MPAHIVGQHRGRRLNPLKPWTPCPRQVTPPPTGAQVAYAEIARTLPHAALGYGITRSGPWARVGDQRVRARTPEAALRQAWAQHLEASRT